MSTFTTIFSVDYTILNSASGAAAQQNAALQAAATGTWLIPLNAGTAPGIAEINVAAMASAYQQMNTDLDNSNYLQAFGDAVSAFGDLAGAVGAVAAVAAPAYGNIIGKSGNAVTQLGIVVSGLTALSSAAATINSIGAGATSLISSLESGFSTVGATLSSDFNAAGTALSSAWTSLSNALVDYGTSMFADDMASFSTNMSSAGSAATTFYNDSGATAPALTQTVNSDNSFSVATGDDTSVCTGNIDEDGSGNITGVTADNGDLYISQSATVNEDGSISDVTQAVDSSDVTQYTETDNYTSDGQISSTMSGQGLVTYLDNASIDVSDGAQVALGGSGNAVDVGSDSDVTMGTGNSVEMNGSGAILNLSDSALTDFTSTNNGTMEELTFSDGTVVDLDSGTMAAVTGTDGTLIADNNDPMGDGTMTATFYYDGGAEMQITYPTGDPDSPAETQTLDFPSSPFPEGPEGPLPFYPYPDPPFPDNPPPGGPLPGGPPPGDPFPDGPPPDPPFPPQYPDPPVPPYDPPDFGSGMADPIVLGMGGSTIELTSLADSDAYFDLYGTSFAVHTGWVGPETGILVDSSDPTSISDLFGSSSVDGFTALQALDSNSDGVIDSSDSGFSSLSVWVDANGDGVADSGEVQSLSSLGITSISLETTPVSENVNGDVISEVATFTYSDDTTGQVAEAYFNNSQINSVFTGSFTLNPDVLSLPDLRGYGTLAPLYAAMSMDSTLLGMVEDLTDDSSMDMSSYADQVTAILFRWAGVDSVDPTSRGAYVNAQVLGVLEAFNGEDYTAFGGGDAPLNVHEGITENKAWDAVFSQVEARLLVQGPLASVFPDVYFNYDTDSLVGSIDYDLVKAATPSGSLQAGEYWNMVSIVDQYVNSSDTALQAAFDDLDLPFTLAQVQAGNYVFGAGDGQNTIVGATSGVLSVMGDLTASDITLQADPAGDLTVTLAATGDSITFDNDLSFIVGSDGSYGDYSMIKQINFSDDTSLSLDEAGPLNFTYTGTSGNTTLTGSSFGNNTFNLGVGGDTVTAGALGNTFNFDEGDGQATVDTNGSLAATGVLNLGSDVSSSDVTLQADSSGDLTVMLSTGDSIIFSNDLSFIGDLDGSYGVYSVISQINFGDDTSLGLDEAGQLSFTYTGTEDNTTLTGSNFGNNTFNLGVGGDTVTAGTVGNTFNFDEGDGQATVDTNGSLAATGVLNLGSDVSSSDVTLQADSSGDLTVMLSTGDSITFSNDLSFIGDLDGSYGVYSVISQINFGDDTSLGLDEAGQLSFTYTGTEDNTTLTGSDFGNNTFNLGVGGDTVTAGTVGNTFNFDEDDGQATVDTNGSLAATGVLNLGSDVSSSDVTLQADSSGDLTVMLSTGDSITFSNDLSFIVGSDAHYGDYSVISQINFGDDTSLQLDESGGPLNFTYAGTEDNTALTGSDFGNNTFNLGVGGDTVTAGTSSNTFNYNEGDGAATLAISSLSYATNTLNCGTGIDDEKLWFTQSGNDLKIDVIDTSDSVTISNWYSDASNQLQEITAGGYEIDSQISSLVSAMATYSSNNPSFDPTVATVMPTDSTLQAAIASAWHS